MKLTHHASCRSDDNSCSCFYRADPREQGRIAQGTCNVDTMLPIKETMANECASCSAVPAWLRSVQDVTDATMNKPSSTLPKAPSLTFAPIPDKSQAAPMSGKGGGAGGGEALEPAGSSNQTATAAASAPILQKPAQGPPASKSATASSPQTTAGAPLTRTKARPANVQQSSVAFPTARSTDTPEAVAPAGSQQQSNMYGAAAGWLGKQALGIGINMVKSS